jgi:cation-transporting ATPase E
VAHITGLSSAQVEQRRRAGQGNDYAPPTSRTYRDILLGNLINFINVVLFIIGGIMVSIGLISDAVTSVGLVVLNVVIGIFQEIRAKRQLDRIALLTRPRITVIRDAAEQHVDPSALVLGDMIVVRPGDQIVVDGVVVDGRMEVDESLLTGESDLVEKVAGDEAMSGSFCVSGSAVYEARRVGAESFANRLTTGARAFRVRKTPLQRDVDFAIRLLTLIASFLGFLLLISTALSSLPLMRTVQASAVVVGIVPNGLFFMIIVAYALGALRIVQKGALVQQSNGVESLSNVTVLCMDKTGTLTANRIHYHQAAPLVSGLSQAQVETLLADFARSARVTNRTSEALAAALPGTKHACADEVPFSSARKWSALSFDSDTRRGCYVLGAVEMLAPFLAEPLDATASAQLEAWAGAGLRVLLFASHPTATRLYDDSAQPLLPPLTPLALVSFTDELRPELQETLRGFAAADIQLKVISGDYPQTVTALARQAGFSGDLTAVSGPQLDALSDDELLRVAQTATIFGRITPQQKERLVDALRRAGHYVAMMGDGVNDVLSLKKADLGIAMQSGSAATRGVADIVLLDDSFAALPPAFQEGQRIVHGMLDILQLFLTRAFYVALLIIAAAVVGVGFPFVPMHISLLTLLTVGIPTFALALWARPGSIREVRLMRSVIHFVVPGALTVFLFGVLIYLATFIIVATNIDMITVTDDEIADFVSYAGITYDLAVGRDSEEQGYIVERALLTAQTALTTFTLFAGLWLIVFVEPPTRWFVAGDRWSGDLKPSLLALVLLGVYLLVVLVPDARRFFQLMPLNAPTFALLLGLSVVWMLVLRFTWRHRLLERFLNIDVLRPEIDFSPGARPQYRGRWSLEALRQRGGAQQERTV